MEPTKTIENRIGTCDDRIADLKEKIADLNCEIKYELGRKHAYKNVQSLLTEKED